MSSNGTEEDDKERRSGSFSSYTWETSFYEEPSNNSQADLILAAKIGKTLLEEKEELKAEYFKIVRKLETVTQENYELKRQLDLAEETNNSLISELQSEVRMLKDKLVERSQNSETEQCLKDDIDRLNSELQEALDKQEAYIREIRVAHDDLKRERLNNEEQIKDILTMKADMKHLSERKDDLERLVLALQMEKESLSISLEEAVAKIIILEKKQSDHETVIRTNEREMEELKTSNHYLLEKLELWSMSHSSSPTLKTSLMSELELSSSDNSGENSLQRSKPFDIIDEEDEEDIEEFDSPTLTCKTESEHNQNDLSLINQEIGAVTSKITNINQNIKSKHNSVETVSNLDDSRFSIVNLSEDPDNTQMSRLKYAVDELDHLVTESFSEKVIDLRSKGCQTDSSTCHLSDPHETFQAQTDLTLSKVKIVELTNEVKKEKVEKAGLLEKVISEKVISSQMYFGLFTLVKVLDANLGGRDFSDHNLFHKSMYPIVSLPNHPLQHSLQINYTNQSFTKGRISFVKL